VYSVLNFGDDLSVFLLKTTSLDPQFMRSVTTAFDRQYLHSLLIFTHDYSEWVFVFPRKEKSKDEKSKLRMTKLVLNVQDLKESVQGVKESAARYSVIASLAGLRYAKGWGWERDVEQLEGCIQCRESD